MDIFTNKCLNSAYIFNRSPAKVVYTCFGWNSDSECSWQVVDSDSECSWQVGDSDCECSWQVADSECECSWQVADSVSSPWINQWVGRIYIDRNINGLQYCLFVLHYIHC